MALKSIEHRHIWPVDLLDTYRYHNKNIVYVIVITIYVVL